MNLVALGDGKRVGVEVLDARVRVQVFHAPVQVGSVPREGDPVLAEPGELHSHNTDHMTVHDNMGLDTPLDCHTDHSELHIPPNPNTERSTLLLS